MPASVLPVARLDDVQERVREPGREFLRIRTAAEAAALIESDAVDAVIVTVCLTKAYSTFLKVPKDAVAAKLRRLGKVNVNCDLDRDGVCWLGIAS